MPEPKKQQKAKSIILWAQIKVLTLQRVIIWSLFIYLYEKQLFLEVSKYDKNLKI